MQTKSILDLRHRLASKLIFTVGITLLVAISTWSYFSMNYQKNKLMQNVVAATDRLTSTIRLGTHYAMMLNSRDDINQIINNIAKVREIKNIRIYNKEGQIKYSNRLSEVDSRTNIEAEACYICHRSEPPLVDIGLEQRTRIFASNEGYRLLGIISPIQNEPGCSSDACHIHPADKKILGALDVVVSLEDIDREVRLAETASIGLTGVVFLIPSAIIFFFVLRFVNRPVRKLIDETHLIGQGLLPSHIELGQADEMGQLAAAINQMSAEIAQKQTELNKQRDEYRTLVERVPCLITVQDCNLRLLSTNGEFRRRFGTNPGEYCYHAYKGRDEKCSNCPVERTFEDGQPHQGEETGFNRDGSKVHWIFRTSPIKNTEGKIVAVLEMSLDITDRKELEEKLERSERKYHEIFNHIPNPVFVMDYDSLEVLDCNKSVTAVYGLTRQDILGRSFLDLFLPEERSRYDAEIRTAAELNQIKHVHKNQSRLVVNIRISPGEYPGRRVLLVTTSDITKRLETEQQLIQASKMATLGEMATGVAHELNQPLSVIKTASSFFIRKIDKNQPVQDETLHGMLKKIDNNVDRATRIIDHMRQFARKSDLRLEKIKLNDILGRAFEIFSQQLRVRGIEVVWDLDPAIPRIMADPSRLEQVFINLLLNARDAIEEKWSGQETKPGDKTIMLRTMGDARKVICEVHDTGKGVPPALADKIFEPFFTTKEVGKGTGLGLSISYGIVQECGGTIRVRPDTAPGACFVLEFPSVESNHETKNPYRR